MTSVLTKQKRKILHYDDAMILFSSS